MRALCASSPRYGSIFFRGFDFRFFFASSSASVCTSLLDGKMYTLCPNLFVVLSGDTGAAASRSIASRRFLPFGFCSDESYRVRSGVLGSASGDAKYSLTPLSHAFFSSPFSPFSHAFFSSSASPCSLLPSFLSVVSFFLTFSFFFLFLRNNLPKNERLGLCGTSVVF